MYLSVFLLYSSIKRTVNAVGKIISLAIWVKRGKKNMSVAYSGTTGILWLELEPTIIIPMHFTMKILVYFSNIPLKQMSVKTFIL